MKTAGGVLRPSSLPQSVRTRIASPLSKWNQCHGLKDRVGVGWGLHSVTKHNQNRYRGRTVLFLAGRLSPGRFS
jgi:hypothetical protein